MTSYPQLDTVLEEIFTRWDVPGLGVGIVENGEITYARGFGVQSLETGTPITPDSIFCVASIGKCFVASAAMQLIERGNLELDTPLVQYLPYFRLDDERFRQITFRQVLSHTSGIPDLDEVEYNDLVANPEYDEGAAERFVRGLVTRKLIAAPGERFAYSNIAYNVLGDVIAKVSGQTFEACMYENILRPAGMPDSTFYYPDVPRDRLAVPHLRIPETIISPIYPYHRADAPSSFLHTTVTEMCHWAITNLNRGSYQGQRILAPSSYDLMWMPVVQRGVPPFREEMGLGWALGQYEGVRTVGHGGGGFGWTCFLALLPERNQAAIILCNEESSAHERALDAVLHTILGLQPQSGTVSLVIPIIQSLRTGGIRAAYACHEDNKDNPEYFFNDYELLPMVYQLMSVGKFDLAIEVLELNLHVFPESLSTFVMLAKILIQKGELTHAESLLHKALAVAPGNRTVTQMLEGIRR